jgi:hypothetical protein
MMGTTDLMTQHHIPENLSPQRNPRLITWSHAIIKYTTVDCHRNCWVTQLHNKLLWFWTVIFRNFVAVILATIYMQEIKCLIYQTSTQNFGFLNQIFLTILFCPFIFFTVTQIMPQNYWYVITGCCYTQAS